jgi:hypothetical protein
MSASKQAENGQVARSAEGGVKPVVYYTEALAPIVKGQRAQVTAYEHYRLGRVGLGGYLNTSQVVEVGEDGTSFETLNTMYVLREPVEADEPSLTDSEVLYHPV